MLSFKQLFESNNSVDINIEKDKILDKISDKGINSLTEEEKAFLDSFKTKNTEEVFNTFEDEMFKFILNKSEPLTGDGEGMRYLGTIYFKNSNISIEGSIYDIKDGRVLSRFKIDEDMSDYEIVDPEDFGYYEDFLNYVTDTLRERL